MPKSMFLFLALLVISCSSPKIEIEPPEPYPYTLTAVTPEVNLDSMFVLYKKFVFDDRVPELAGLKNPVAFPEVLPNIVIVEAERIQSAPGRVYTAFDTVATRFYNLTVNGFRDDFSELMRTTHPDGIDSLTAFRTAAVFMKLRSAVKYLVCRKADVYLAEKVDQFIQENYQPKPGVYNREFDRYWWGWQAFPTANNDYRQLFSKYADSMAVSPLIADIPEDAALPPRVVFDGRNYNIAIYYVNSSQQRTINRFDIRIKVDGTIEGYNDGQVYVFNQDSSL